MAGNLLSLCNLLFGKLAGGLGFGLLTGGGVGEFLEFFSGGLDFFFRLLQFGDFLGEFF